MGKKKKKKRLRRKLKLFQQRNERTRTLLSRRLPSFLPSFLPSACFGIGEEGEGNSAEDLDFGIILEDGRPEGLQLKRLAHDMDLEEEDVDDDDDD